MLVLIIAKPRHVSERRKNPQFEIQSTRRKWHGQKAGLGLPCVSIH